MGSYANDRGGDDDDREGVIACRTRFAFLAGRSFYYAYVCEPGNEDLFVPIETSLFHPRNSKESTHRKRACFDKVCERRIVQVTGIRISNANRAAFTIVRRSTIDALRSISRSPSSYRISSRRNLAASFPLGTV